MVLYYGIILYSLRCVKAMHENDLGLWGRCYEMYIGFLAQDVGLGILNKNPRWDITSNAKLALELQYYTFARVISVTS